MNFRLLLLFVFGIWIGMLLGISFLEAPLKFQAPKMTMPLALSVGQIVFDALNKVEVIFSIITIVSFFIYRNQIEFSTSFMAMGVVIILTLQTYFLLPILDQRASLIISGGTPEDSKVHLFYILGEISKVILLFWTFIKIFKNE